MWEIRFFEDISPLIGLQTVFCAICNMKQTMRMREVSGDSSINQPEVEVQENMERVKVSVSPYL